jgi:hypothetical protein
MRFMLQIDCDNAAFEGDELYMETGRIVATVAELVSDGQTSGFCRDSNGNRVGTWSLAPAGED